MTDGALSARSVSYVTPPKVQDKTRKNADEEEKILFEFKQKLDETMGIGIEAFFRMCDKGYSQNVEIADFKNMITSQGIKMDAGNINRLI